MTTLDELVAEKGWVIADGATGTNYFKLGLETLPAGTLEHRTSG